MNYFEIVQKLAKEHGYSAKRLEREAGFSEGAIYKWKTHAPTIEKIVAVANVLGVSVDEVLGIKKEPAESELDEQIVRLLKDLPEEKLQRVRDFLAGLSGS